MKYLLSLSLLLATLLVFAQDEKSPKDMLNQAIYMMDNGQYDESIALLEKAATLDTNQYSYQYEIGYAYLLKKDYRKAIKTYKEVIKMDNAKDQAYQMLGNCYDYAGKRKKAIKTYTKGLDRFPRSGCLHLELGVVQNDLNKSLNLWEKGIIAKPDYPSNYYQAAQIFLNYTEEEIWGLFYGEIFMNLERNSRRTNTMSKMLYDTYQKEIELLGDSATVSFCEKHVILLNEDIDLENFKKPFSLIYETSVGMAISNVSSESMSIATINTIRSEFLSFFDMTNEVTGYQNILIDYHNKIEEAGHLEAYNYWIFMKGDEEAFSTWQENNEDKWKEFLVWFILNPLKIDDENMFSRLKVEGYL